MEHWKGPGSVIGRNMTGKNYLRAKFLGIKNGKNDTNLVLCLN